MKILAEFEEVPWISSLYRISFYIIEVWQKLMFFVRSIKMVTKESKQYSERKLKSLSNDVPNSLIFVIKAGFSKNWISLAYFIRWFLINTILFVSSTHISLSLWLIVVYILMKKSNLKWCCFNEFVYYKWKMQKNYSQKKYNQRKSRKFWFRTKGISIFPKTCYFKYYPNA